MTGRKGEWNDKLKYLRSIILDEEFFAESIDLILYIHSMTHVSEMSGIDDETFEDEVWDGLEERIFREKTSPKGRTIAYNLWHCARIEDITMNILVSDCNQIIDSDDFLQRMNMVITETGNSLNKEEILEMSARINIEELRNYRLAVGRRTREIIGSFRFDDLKRKFKNDQLYRILEEGAVKDVPSANWLIDFWGKKNVAGILLMPVTRHNLVHINDSARLKPKKRKNRNKTS